MTERLRPEFTETLAEAFGTDAGRDAELATAKHLQLSGVKHIWDWASNREKQLQGIDISYFNEWDQLINLQVKRNYDIPKPRVRGAPAPRTFSIEDQSYGRHNIRFVQAEFMIHINMYHYQFVMYETARMIEYLDETDDDLNHYQKHHISLIRFKDNAFDFLHTGDLRH